MDANDVLNFALGAAEVLLALVVATYLWRLGRAFPWLALLIVFFLMRGAERIYAAFTESDRLGSATDIVLVAVVLLLALTVGQTARALDAAHREASIREAEYGRALADYRRLARHRLANPLTAIRGSITTLRELPDLDDATRAQLLEAIDEESQRLERIALEPEIGAAEERGLDPRPHA